MKSLQRGSGREVLAAGVFHVEHCGNIGGQWVERAGGFDGGGLAECFTWNIFDLRRFFVGICGEFWVETPKWLSGLSIGGPGDGR
jgi:hypothetical protein